MYSLIRKLFFLFLLTGVVGFATRNYWLKQVFQSYVNHHTDFSLEIESTDFSQFFPPSLLLYEFVLTNPEDFSWKPALTVSRLEIKWPSHFWQTHQAQAKKVTLEIEKIIFTVNADGKVNFSQWKSLPPPSFLHLASSKTTKPAIEELVLSIHEVLFYDERKVSTHSPWQHFHRNLKEKTFHRISNQEELKQLILQESLQGNPFRGLPPELQSKSQFSTLK